MKTLKNTLRNYGRTKLTEADCPADPIVLFTTWLNEALQHEPYEANTMTLATVDGHGKPCARIVLLKEVATAGFTFFTNYESAKGRQLAINPHAALVFWWQGSERQVRVQGIVEKTSAQVSSDYFQSRSKDSKIGAHVSNQSQIIAGREELQQRFTQMQADYVDTDEIPRPAHWGGYIVKPVEIEFWQGGAHRLHDRICYKMADGQWKLYRLAP